MSAAPRPKRYKIIDLADSEDTWLAQLREARDQFVNDRAAYAMEQDALAKATNT